MAVQKKKKMTLHDKIDQLSKRVPKAAPKAPKVKSFTPVKLSLVNSRLAGASSLVNKVREAAANGDQQ